MMQRILAWLLPIHVRMIESRFVGWGLIVAGLGATQKSKMWMDDPMFPFRLTFEEPLSARAEGDMLKIALSHSREESAVSIIDV